VLDEYFEEEKLKLVSLLANKRRLDLVQERNLLKMFGGNDEESKEAIIDANFCADLYTFADKTYLSILELETDEFYALELQDKGGTEFNFLEKELKLHVKTSSYSPQSNGKIERIHKKLGATYRLYSTTPDQISELWRSGSIASVNMSKRSEEVGGLILRYVQKIQSKVMDCWTGPFIIQKRFNRLTWTIFPSFPSFFHSMLTGRRISSLRPRLPILSMLLIHVWATCPTKRISK
jgi:hypothetical protein